MKPTERAQLRRVHKQQRRPRAKGSRVLRGEVGTTIVVAEPGERIVPLPSTISVHTLNGKLSPRDIDYLRAELAKPKPEEQP